MTAFDFGENWKRFSAARVDEARFAEATASLQRLFPNDALRGMSFLDVGCGSGLFSLAAARLGAAPVIGIDINPLCVSTSSENRVRLQVDPSVTFRMISALDRPQVEALGAFDVTYAWGSLHHTGDMWRAIENVAHTVRPGGTLVIAIYAKHFSSGAWRLIKRAYNTAPMPLQRVMLWILAPIIYAAKFAVTGANPLRKDRGMDFWFDVVDWVGGYPYEYASIAEIQQRVGALGFAMTTVNRASVPTGCHEYILKKVS